MGERIEDGGRVLTRSHWDALAELASYEGSNRTYWWREASMKVLIEHGFAEQYCPPSVAERPRMKRRPYRITEAGLAALAGGSSHV